MHSRVNIPFLLVVSAGWALSVLGQPVVWNLPAEDTSVLSARGFSPMPGVESATIYDVNDNLDGVYNHHPHITAVGDRLVATWSNHLEGNEHTSTEPQNGEDGPGQKVMVSTSNDGGTTWSAATDLVSSVGGYGHAFDAGRVLTANGFARVGDDVYAISEVHDGEAKQTGESRVRTGLGRLARKVNADGTLGDTTFWLDGDPPEPLEGYSQFPDPVSNPELADTAEAIRNYLAEPLNQPAWNFREERPVGDGEEMVEPSTYERPDGTVVRLYRDAGKRGYLYASESSDGGQTLSTPEQTNVPDSPSKTISGSLPDGRTYMIGNLINEQLYRRDPLMLAISRDGVTYDWAAAIRHDAPGIQFPGPGKGTGYQYPSASIVGDEMVITYSVGKEDVAFSRFSIPEFADGPGASSLLTLSSSGDRLVRFDGTTGNWVDQFTSGGAGAMSAPQAVVQGPDGRIYVSSRGNNRILRFDAQTGAFVDTFADSGLNAPTGLAFDDAGDLYVANRYGDNVVKFAGPGKPTAGESLGVFADASSSLDGPFNMAFSDTGDLFVTSFDDAALLQYDDEGSFVRAITHSSLSRPQGVAIDDEGHLYVSDAANHTVLRFSSADGSFIDTLIAAGSGGLDQPNSLGFDDAGNLLVSSRLTSQILRYDGDTGEFLDVFAYGGGLQGATGFTLVQAIPEPSSLALLALAAAALGRQRPQWTAATGATGGAGALLRRAPASVRHCARLRPSSQ